LLIDHGSRLDEANRLLDEIAVLVRAQRGGDALVEVAHMDLAEPTIAVGFARCVAAGATEVVAVPYFLGPGRHATEDVPRLVAEAAEAHDGVGWEVAEVLGAHPLLAQLVIERAGLRPPQFELWRQDERGDRVCVERFESLEDARAELARFERHTHEQHYWIERTAPVR
jgi:sirohydrochlorin ferrochelatase